MSLRFHSLTFGLMLTLGLTDGISSAFADDLLPIPPSRACPQSTDFIIPGTTDGLAYPWDLIWAEYMRIGGPEGPIGCPIGGLIKNGPNGGAFMNFENGQIAVSPSVWERGVVAAYQNGNELIVDWTVSLEEPSHYNYTKFLVRWDYKRLNDSKFTHYDDFEINGKKPCELRGTRGDGDQCDVLADMTEVQLVLLHYYQDTHLRTKGTFSIPVDHGDGYYRIELEGCDEGHVGGSTCRQGWMHSVIVNYKASQPITIDGDDGYNIEPTDYTLDLSDVPSANDVDGSKTALFKRAAAYTLINACHALLPYKVYRNEEQYMQVIMAKLDYANYYLSDLQGDHCPGRDVGNRQEAIQSLAQQTIDSKSGTTVDSCPGCRTGEYDVALSGYIPILNRFGEHLPNDVYFHILDLLNKRGPLDLSDHSLYFGGPVNETENHINMIESSRYLTNDLLFALTGDPQYDNTKNAVFVSPEQIASEPEQIPPGVQDGPNAPPFAITMRDYWLRRLHHFLQTDFIEYNARPYQDYTMHSLQNLASFAHDPQVQTAAQMVLNYVYAKVAVSSNDNRRSVPYRRRAEDNSPNLLGFHSDPQAGRTFMLGGDFSILSETGLASPKTGEKGVMAPWYDQDQWTIESSYTIPDPILDLTVGPNHRLFYQGIHHYADELYASSPSFLISAGGHYATNAYKAVGIFGSHSDIGLALPTTVTPTGFFLSRNALIRFEGRSDDTLRSNMCVAPNFACGINPVLPHIMTTMGCVIQNAPWTFINFTSACRNDSSPNGFYAALYQREDVNLDGERFHTGFVEVFDTRINPQLSFEEFWQGEKGVLARNGDRKFSSFKKNVYVTTTGQEITFVMAPDSRVLTIANGPVPVQSTTDFATGTILQSGGTSGLVTITNPFNGMQMTLDDRDPLNPVQTAGAVSGYAPDTCLIGFVWREATQADHVCVTVNRRAKTQAENALADERRSPIGGPYGPDTCKEGFVWREAFPGDHVCVPPDSRSEARWDNKLAPSRSAFPQL